jgi:Cu2+-containing amine oxidase
LSPWHSLTEEEIKTAAAALIGREGNAIVINRISLKEPNKQAAKAWQSNEPGTTWRRLTLPVR